VSDSVVVVGGGIAGIAAAVALAERGVAVTLVERETSLGGRAGAFAHRLASGESVQMERGFHAFFRQYYNLRALLRRISADLSVLQPLADYPVLAPGGGRQSFAGLPTSAPWNIVAMARRSSALTLRALRHVNVREALRMLAFHPEHTYARHDHRNAKDYLDGLAFPPEARRMLFDVFAHSFFNPEGTMSAAEMVMMFHFYFVGNPEGLIFDVVRQPMSTALWTPLQRHLEQHGATVRTGVRATAVDRSGDGWQIGLDDGSRVAATDLILALDVPGLHALVNGSQLDSSTVGASVRALSVTQPFAVWRLWLSQPTDPGRQPFVGTAGYPLLDNISLYHLFEDESRDWAVRHAGSVVELHAYAVPDGLTDADLRAAMLAGLHDLYPELRSAATLDEVYLVRQDCPAFAPGSHAGRPTVTTDVPHLYLAGDFVRLPNPSALMERAATAGFVAANRVLRAAGLSEEPLRSIQTTGILGAIAA
jgi:isorenieratene synthase